MYDPELRVLGATPFQAALNDFQKARLQGSLQEVVARLWGKPATLLSYEKVARQLQVTNRAASGARPIPLQAIVGSVGRYNDFTHAFLPRQDTDAQRWARVKAAGDVSTLPAIQVYQLGESYFVLDGNHRVSIARQQGLTHIDAEIIRVDTRVPFSPGDDAHTLILKAEQAQFLADTGLGGLRPAADFRVSVCGQYRHLENLIEVHRYFAEVEQGRETDDEEAILRWYDEAYLPTIEAIRERGLLRYFPGRTETDFYVWVARHQAELQKDLGWSLPVDVAASSLAHKLESSPQGALSHLARLLRRVPWLSGKLRQGISEKTWAEERVAARYSGQLFADILVPFVGKDEDWQALNQAVALARRENARIYGLYVGGDGRVVTDLEADLRRACEDAGVECFLAVEEGDRVEAICRRSQWADLLVLSPWFATADDEVEAMARHCPRPLLLVAGEQQPMRRALLVYDGGAGARQALFAAVYMAEFWSVTLTVLRNDGRRRRQDQSYLRDYLALHEIEVIMEVASEFSPEKIVAVADRHRCDLVLMSAPGKGTRGLWAAGAKEPGEWPEVLQRSLFLCT